MEQTSSSELEVFFSAPATKSSLDEERSINPISGWSKAWDRVESEISALKTRVGSDSRLGAEVTNRKSKPSFSRIRLQ